MRKILVPSVFLFAVFSCLLIGCGGGGGGGGANPVGEPTGNYANLSGQVQFNGQPAAGVAVYLVKPATALEQGISQVSGVKAGTSASVQIGEYQTTTDSSGNYVFQNVLVGEYTLIAVRSATEQAVRTGVIVGQYVEVPTIQLTPTGKVTGTVTISGATDLSGTLVYLEGTSFVGITDPTGNYTLSNVPSSSVAYVLRVQRVGYAPQSVSGITVTPAGLLTVPALTLSAAVSDPTMGSFHGTVQKQSFIAGDSDHGGIFVHVVGTPFLTVSQPSGAYSFGGIPTGTYQLSFFSDNYAAVGMTFPSVTVVVGSDVAVSGPVLFVPKVPQGDLTGTVHKNPRLASDTDDSGIIVKLATATQEFIAVSDAVGVFRFLGVPKGQYQLTFPTGVYQYLGTVQTVAVDTGSTLPTAFQVVPVDPGVTLGVFVGNVAKSTRVNGEANDSGIIVRIASGSVTAQVLTDSTGQFTFTGLPVGPGYTLSFSSEYYRLNAGLSSGTAVVVTTTVPATPPRYRFDPINPAMVTGVFGGRAVKSQFVQGEGNDAGIAVRIASGAMFAETVTDGAGSFGFQGLPLGPGYVLTFSSELYQLNAGLSSGTTVAVTMAAPSPVPGYRFDPINVPVLTGVFGGRVVKSLLVQGEANNAGIVVRIASGTRTGETVTDDSGNFTFNGLPLGPGYLLTFSSELYQFNPGLSSGTTVAVTATIPTPRPGYRFDPVNPPAGTGVFGGHLFKSLLVQGEANNAGIVVRIASGTRTAETVSDDMGNFTFNGLPLGPGYLLTFSSELYQLNSGLSSGTTVAVTATIPTPRPGYRFDPLTAPVTLGVFGGRAFKSLLIEGEATNAGIVVRISSGPTEVETVTDNTGNFRFRDLPVGSGYALSFSSELYQINAGLSSPTASVAVVLTLPSPLPGYRFDPVNPPVSMGVFGGCVVKTVLVQGEGNNAGVAVRIASGTNVAEVTSDGTGNFVFNGLPIGPGYSLVFASELYQFNAGVSATTTVSVAGTLPASTPFYIFNPITAPVQTGPYGGIATKSVFVEGETNHSGIIVRLASGPQTVAETQTDATGNFRFSGVPQWTGYTLSFVSSLYSLNTGVSSPTTSIAVIGTLPTPQPRFLLDPLVPTGGYAGIATKSVFVDGESTHAGIIVRLSTGSVNVAETQTDGAGYFRFSGVRQGTGYTLVFESERYSLVSGSSSPTTSITVTGTLPAPLPRFLFAPITAPDVLGGLTGVITKAGTLFPSEDNSGVTVQIATSGSNPFQTTSGAGGAFSFTGVPVGNYDFSIVSQDYYPVGAPSTVTIATPPTALGSVVVTPRTYWAGRVVGSFTNTPGYPQSPVEVELVNASKTYKITTQINAAGVFSFESVPPGTYTLQFASGSGFLFAAGPVFAVNSGQTNYPAPGGFAWIDVVPVVSSVVVAGDILTVNGASFTLQTKGFSDGNLMPDSPQANWVVPASIGFDISSLLPGKHFLKVQNIDGSYDGNWTFTIPLATPTLISFSSTDISLTISWSDVPLADRYSVSISGTNFPIASTTTVFANSFTFSGLGASDSCLISITPLGPAGLMGSPRVATIATKLSSFDSPYYMYSSLIATSAVQFCGSKIRNGQWYFLDPSLGYLYQADLAAHTDFVAASSTFFAQDFEVTSSGGVFKIGSGYVEYYASLTLPVASSGYMQSPMPICSLLYNPVNDHVYAFSSDGASNALINVYDGTGNLLGSFDVSSVLAMGFAGWEISRDGSSVIVGSTFTGFLQFYVFTGENFTPGSPLNPGVNDVCFSLFKYGQTGLGYSVYNSDYTGAKFGVLDLPIEDELNRFHSQYVQDGLGRIWALPDFNSFDRVLTRYPSGQEAGEYRMNSLLLTVPIDGVEKRIDFDPVTKQVVILCSAGAGWNQPLRLIYIDASF